MPALTWTDDGKIVAPLSELQLDLLHDICLYVKKGQAEKYDDCITKNSFNEDTQSESTHDKFNKIKTNKDFLKWYSSTEEELEEEYNTCYKEYNKKLSVQNEVLYNILYTTDLVLENLGIITTTYNDISTRTTLLNETSEKLYADVMKLEEIAKEIEKRLYYFVNLSSLSDTLSASCLPSSTTNFFEALEKTDEFMDFMLKHSHYKETYVHLTKLKQTLYNVMFLIKNYAKQIFKNAAEHVSTTNETDLKVTDTNKNSDDIVFSWYYGKFQTSATKLRPIIEQLELRTVKNSEFAELLAECQHCYLTERLNLMNPAIANAITQLVSTHENDNCILFRSACTFILHACQDETHLYNRFFKDTSPQLVVYLEKLCTHLYDNLRPRIVHINHIEILVELCGILQNEITANCEKEDAFLGIIWQLLEDVQERLVYRTHVFLQTDVLQYSPSSGDLAYPEKLETIENISQGTQNVVASPVDLHDMWYPTVKRTLLCLSRLYRCVDKPIFQGLSQEAITICLHTLITASNTISANKTIADGELFLIRHLLILREQIVPFQVDFTIKETCLDFSNIKSAAFNLIQKRTRLFALNVNNAFLEFIFSASRVKEQLIDSRKEVDRQLKCVCETFIEHCTQTLTGPIELCLHNFEVENGDTQIPPEVIRNAILEARHNIKMYLPVIQKSMLLYLANKETEYILFKLIRNNVVNNFSQLELQLFKKYSADQLLIIGCPTTEQVSVILSSLFELNI